MKVTLEMLGAMRKPFGQGPVDVEVEEGTTVRDFVVGKLGYKPEQVRLLSCFINGKSVKPATVLSPGCILKILMIIGGG